MTNLPDNPDVFMDENGKLEDIYGEPVKPQIVNMDRYIGNLHAAIKDSRRSREDA